MTESVVFDRAADYYDETRGFPPGVERPVGALLQNVGHLTPRSRVLEVGVGTGRIALPLGAHVGLVVGVDLSPLMLARLVAKRTDQPVFPICADAVGLPFSAGTFDAVIGVHVFHLIPDWQGALRAIARVLKPGGVLLQGWNKVDTRDEANDPLWAAWDAAVGVLDARNVGVKRADYGTFLTDQNWQMVGEEHQVVFKRSRTPATFLDQLERRVWSSMWRLPDDVIARGIAAVRAVIDERGFDLHAPLEYDASFHVQAYAPPVAG